MCTILHEIVYEAVKQIPRGKVTTYKAIAEALGDPIAARTVARILSENPDPERVPCYKVVMSDGRLGGYAFGGEKEKARKLKEEGIRVVGGKVDLKKYFFKEFDVYPILEKMKEAQITIASLNRKEDVEFDYVIGVDVAYKGCYGVGVAVLFDKRGNHVQTAHWKGRVSFPYVPTYLAFREAPFMVKAVERIGEGNALLLVDGHGIEHPRRAGEAVHVGAVLDLPSIGVAKRPLRKSHKPFRGSYPSPGWKLPEVPLEQIWFGGRKQPKPIEVADRVSKLLRREIP